MLILQNQSYRVKDSRIQGSMLGLFPKILGSGTLESVLNVSPLNHLNPNNSRIKDPSL
jgi:hypothetical protein